MMMVETQTQLRTKVTRVSLKGEWEARFPQGSWSGFLMSRDVIGRPMKERFLECADRMLSDTLLIDFTGVSEISNSVAEEVGPIFFREFVECRGNRDLYIVYINVCKEVANGLGAAFEWINGQISEPDPVAIAFQSESPTDGVFILGKLPMALRATLLAIYEAEGESTSIALESIGIKAASKKLSDLVSSYPWLVRKEQRFLGSGSWAYSYLPVFRSY